MKTINEFNDIARSEALGGAKVPHGISNPVLRLVDGTIRVCYFVYLFDKEALETGLYRRPVEWLALDMKSGDLVGRYSCAKNDFSQEPANKEYLLKDSSVTKPDKAFYAVLNRLFETACASVLFAGTLDEATYEGYLSKVLSITPQDYRVFYEDLSQL